ncbi:hypothetical protein GTA51_18745 [Desulfovibrio aerotolerans]|uniref:Uncharacterized protein n=1 Tax=Solidesulfovibrio aerotolerans TaxID=295255 RepID=A0A7C9ITZ3_9BACT|nr:hypothetical protein [Solidesulfovibrio aerotolerans]MYL85147.1 hypothetical protein [Solidesulfovibrio aerotolerans]
MLLEIMGNFPYFPFGHFLFCALVLGNNSVQGQEVSFKKNNPRYQPVVFCFYLKLIPESRVNTKQPPAEAGGFKACGLKVQLHHGEPSDLFTTPM